MYYSEAVKQGARYIVYYTKAVKHGVKLFCLKVTSSLSLCFRSDRSQGL